MMQITKSLYVTYTQCPALAWNDCFNHLPDNSDKTRALEGIRVGEIARDIFPNWEMFDIQNPQTNPGVYAEYIFVYGDLECRADIVVINDDRSLDLYEVKSVNDIDKKKYLEDISFQYYVANKLGYKIKSANLISLNPDYVYDGVQYDLSALFKITDKTDEIVARLNEVEDNINALRMFNDKHCPRCPFNSKCKEENSVCRYLDRCKALYGLPITHSAFELYGNAKKMDFINDGCLSWDDIAKSGKELSDYNRIMIDCYINKTTTPVVRKDELREYLGKVKYPVYFFDFEGAQDIIPLYKDSRPYVQIPFQYSLHISNSINDTEQDILNRHKEYLGDGVNDPREDLIKQMIIDLGKEGTIFVYNETYEKSRIKDLIKDFSYYQQDLEPLLDRIMDLEDVFKYHPDSQLKVKVITRGKNKGQIKKEFDGPALATIYHPLMENSCSIKRVLPSFFPDRDDLDYHQLDQVHRGDEAIIAYKKLKTLNGTAKDTLRKNMLKYCCLDTKAMVVLYLKFIELSK